MSGMWHSAIFKRRHFEGDEIINDGIVYIPPKGVTFFFEY